MRFNNEWKDYEIIATGGGEKLERWGKYYLLRPDPQAIWKPSFDFASFDKLDAYYRRSKTGGGAWTYLRKLPDEWTVGWRDLRFTVKPMGFKHTGLFPEQAVNWAKMIELIKSAKRPVSALNLFGYTGGATVAALSAGATVCHVDAAKNMNERAKSNVALSGIADGNARFLVDDCFKFVARELKRKRYDAIIMDPPSYGRGPKGETWKLEDSLYDFVELTSGLLSDRPLFFLINSYTTGLQPAVLNNILKLTTSPRGGSVESYEVCLPTNEGIVLPCGASAMKIFD